VAEGRRQEAEGRRQKAGGRRQEAKGRGQKGKVGQSGFELFAISPSGIFRGCGNPEIRGSCL